MSETGSETIQRISIVDNVTVLLRRALLGGRDQAGRADQGRRAGEELRRQPHPDPRGRPAAGDRRPDRRAAAARRRRRGRRPRGSRRALRPAPDRRVRGDPPVGRAMTDEQVEAVRSALAALEAVAQDHECRTSGSSTATSTGRSSSRARATGSAVCSTRSGLASQRYVRLFVSETVDDAMADHRQLLVHCEQRAGGPAAELLRRHLDRTELAVREAFTPIDEQQRQLVARRARLRVRGSARGRRAPRSAARRGPGGRRAARRGAQPRRSRDRLRAGSRPAARRCRTCPGSKASAASCSPRASRRGRASGPPGAASASRVTAPSPSGSPPRTRRWSRFRRLPTTSSRRRSVRSAWPPGCRSRGSRPCAPGETVLVLGATGSVGSVAVQVAKLLGASRVVAVGRDAQPARGGRRARSRRDRRARRRRLPGAARGCGRRRAADARARPAVRPGARGRRGRRGAGRPDRARRAVVGARRRRSSRATSAASSFRSSATPTSRSRWTCSPRATRT